MSRSQRYCGTVNTYHAYLIRFLRREGNPHWCATLENVHTREHLQFATERELLVYLLQTLSENASPETAGPKSSSGAE